MVVAALVAALGATTWWALESGDVAVIETRTPEGTVRSTHVWYTEPDEELWLEAGAPGNAWFQDVQQNPVVTFIRANRANRANRADRRSARYVARPVDHPSGHTRIRSLLRDKYGFRDRWVGLLVDTCRRRALRRRRGRGFALARRPRVERTVRWRRRRGSGRPRRARQPWRTRARPSLRAQCWSPGSRSASNRFPTVAPRSSRTPASRGRKSARHAKPWRHRARGAPRIRDSWSFPSRRRDCSSDSGW